MHHISTNKDCFKTNKHISYIFDRFQYLFRRSISESIKNDGASGSAKAALIKVVVLHPTTMEKDQCYLISTKRPKTAIREDNPKIQADYCNMVTNIYLLFSSRDILMLISKTIYSLFVTPSFSLTNRWARKKKISVNAHFHQMVRTEQ